MVKRVQQCLDLLLTLLHLAVKLISIPLKLFLLLGSLDDIVGLRVLTLGLDFATAGLVTLDEALVLDAKVLDLVVALLELNLDLVALLLSSLQLTDKDVLVHLDFLFALLHGHLQLVLSVLKAVHFVSTSVDFLAQALDLELHDVVLNQGLLFLFDHSFEITASHLVLELQLANGGVKSSFLFLDFDDDAVNVAALILKLLV